MNGDSAKIRAAILQIDIFTRSSGLQSAGAIWRSPFLGVFLQPGEIFIGAGCVNDEQKFLLVDPVSDQIINDSAALVEEKSILAYADFELVNIVCENRIEPCARAGSLNDQLSHVRNIEDPDVVSHGLMLLHNARVLHRH